MDWLEEVDLSYRQEKVFQEEVEEEQEVVYCTSSLLDCF